jgi:chlorophyll synthase
MDARAILGLVRPFTMLAPVTGVLCAAGAASARLGVPIDGLSLGLAVGAALLANAASNAWNQAFDADIDRLNKPARPIPSGRASVRGASALGHLCAALGVALAALHAWRAGHAWFLGCLVVGVLATWAYSAPPLRTKRRTYGALVTIAVPRGFLVPVAGWSVVAAPAGLEPFALGLVPGLFVLGAATTKDFADVEGDRAHGCRTLPVVLGPARAARRTAPFLALPFLLYPALAALGALARPLVAWAVLGGALAAVGAYAAALLVRAPERLATERNHPAWRAMYLLMLANQVGVWLVYALTASPAPVTVTIE